MRVPIIDGHNDLAWQIRDRALGDLDLSADLTALRLHTDLPRLRKGGVSAQFWSVYVPCAFDGPAAFRATLEQIDVVRGFVARHPAELELATTAEDVERIAASGRIASLLGAEGGHCIDSDLDNLRALYDHGVRYLTLTHALNTPWADSATDAPAVGGLTDFGRDVVREMNRLGMLVDLSHVAPSTMHAALDVSTAPAFFSHSSARALCDHPRNVPDDVLTRVRDSEGVVMVTFVPGFLNEACRAWFVEMVRAEEDPQWPERRDAWFASNPRPPCDVRDAADHVEHVRDVAGVDCVGLGGDFDGVPALPDGLDDVAGYPALIDELRSRGWSEADLRKLGWENTLRVLKQTQGESSLEYVQKMRSTRAPTARE